MIHEFSAVISINTGIYEQKRIKDIYYTIDLVCCSGFHYFLSISFKFAEDIDQSVLYGHWCQCFKLLVTPTLGFKPRLDPPACILRHL